MARVGARKIHKNSQAQLGDTIQKPPGKSPTPS
jgi:hypothetical protein